VGTSGAPLVADDGIAGMIVADDAGGVSRALGIAFIERAFSHWAHPWQLREEDAVATAAEDVIPPAAGPPPAPPATAATEARPSEPHRPPAVATGPREDRATPMPDAAFDLGEIRRAIEAELAHYDPSAPLAGPAEDPPGVLAPALAIGDPEVRIAGPQKLEVAGYVRLDDLDLGHVSAVVTPKEQDRLAVTITLDGLRAASAGCAIEFQQQAFDLDWNRVVAALTGVRAAFSPIAVRCPDFRLLLSEFRIDSAMAEGEDGLWSGEVDLVLGGLEVTGGTGEELLRTDAAEIRLALRGFDLGARARLLRSLPPHYWPRRVALLGIPFDLGAADRGVLSGDPSEVYAGDASISDLSAALSGLKAVVEDGPERVNVELAKGTIELRSTPLAALSYRHDGLSIAGAGMGVPNELAVDLRLGQADVGPMLSAVQSEQDLLSFLEQAGPIAWEVASTSARSAAAGTGAVWVKPGARAPSANASLLSGDPTTFLLDTFLGGLAQEADLAALSRAIEETVDMVGRVVRVGGGLQYQFEIEADFESEQVVINGINAAEVTVFFNDACAKYGC
jgi:hypothetical protein